MGCASSSQKSHVVHQTRQDDLLSNMMNNVASIQSAHLQKQQMMIQNDPECKTLYEKQLDINKRALEATMKGNGGADVMLGIQKEYAELYQHPKWVKMMTPDISNFNMSHNVNAMPFGVSMGNPSTTTNECVFSSNAGGQRSNFDLDMIGFYSKNGM
mmetsp:Transcript_11291/g.14160  ORF Transcript_11291/g.14160 Transcript_11291/m.14160 type:complete len:157 (+) Transcript_11291:180-650(+)